MSQEILEQINQSKGRLDKVLADLYPDRSRSYLQKLIKDQLVQVNHQIVKANYQLEGGESISIVFPEMVEEEAIEVIAQNMDLDIVYEDAAIIVVNKAAGQVVHPSKGHPKDTLVNGLYGYLGDQLAQGGDVFRPGIVHRIDKDTSGLLVVAKTDQAHQSLSKQLTDHSMGRTYYALVNGVISSDTGHIDLPVRRDPSNRLRWHVDEQGKHAWTDFKVLHRYQYASFLELKLRTGRTHQIRIHLEAIGHPIIGDPVYRRNLQNLPGQLAQMKDGQLLHAGALDLVHPVSQAPMHFECPLPERMTQVMDCLL